MDFFSFQKFDFPRPEERKATFEDEEKSKVNFSFNSQICHLLIIFANSLDLDQAQQDAGPDLDPNCLILDIPERIFRKSRF